MRQFLRRILVRLTPAWALVPLQYVDAYEFRYWPHYRLSGLELVMAQKFAKAR
jgi:hypothetical protein